MSRRLFTVVGIAGLLTGALAIGLSGVAQAQVNPFAPPAASDALNSASPSGGLNSGTYIGRANEAAAAANSNPFAAPAGGSPYQQPPGPASPVFPGAAAYGAFPGAPGAFPGGPGGYLAPTPTPGPPPVTVVTGERVYSHLQFGAYPPELLQDAEKIKVPGVIPELKKQYFDDGTHGDAKAGDNTWTYITKRNDVMSPEEYRILNRILAALTSGEDTDPRDFFRLPVATTEPLSELPKMMNLEASRDDKISEWNKRVLAEFRISKDDVNSQFWPVFVPPPPSAPRIEIPPGYDPSARPSPTGQAGGQFGPGGFGGPAGPMGEGMPAGASSSYGFAK